MITTEFLLTSLVVVLVPGTGVIYTVSNGLFLGWRASIAAAIGCTLGIIPHLSASILGLSTILHMSALAYQAIKFAGALYLLYLAWGMWKDKGVLQLDTSCAKRKYRQIVCRGFLINILNPKLSIFFLAFLPLFVSPAASSPTLQLAYLSLVFMGMTLGVFILYGFSANSVRYYVVNSPKIIKRCQRAFAVLFAGIGAKLALTD
ncbi:LysE family translocator [Desulfogranum japonicum]|uniref:LysE family translocator n=1 Tax=Desulfogranum japonicum TaxID=231447 RepID=UPI0004912A3D|nr:LysE family translocator [Desulfogranum japonicum]